MSQMLAEQRRATEAILTLAEVLKQQPTREIVREIVSAPPVEPLSTAVKSDFTATLQLTDKKTPSPKLILALEWLLAHPEDMGESTRKLGTKLSISHTWVSEAKKLIETGEYKNILIH
jgi:hypothetical protein